MVSSKQGSPLDSVALGERESESRAIFTQFLVQHFPLTLSTSCPLQPHSCWLDDEDDLISNCAGLIVCVTKLVCFRSISFLLDD